MLLSDVSSERLSGAPTWGRLFALPAFHLPGSRAWLRVDSKEQALGLSIVASVSIVLN